MEDHNNRPFREGWEIAPDMEGSIEDEQFTDCEKVVEAWGELVNRAKSAGGRVGALLDSGKVMAALDEIHDAAASQMGELRERLEVNTSPQTEPSVRP